MGLKFEACDVFTTMRHGGNPLAATDPFTVNATAGGALPAERLGGAQCVGPIAHAPDLRLNYRAGQGLPLYLSAVPGADVTLVANLPDGRWACHDDRQGTNPGLLFPQPRPGPYDIRIGQYRRGSRVPAQLRISEVPPNRAAPRGIGLRAAGRIPHNGHRNTEAPRPHG